MNPERSARSARNRGGPVLLTALVLSLAFALGAASCATSPAAIPEDASPAVIIQRAQERSDVYDWKGAEHYYRILLERFADTPELVCTAEYEIAFTKYKRGDYKGAREGLKALLARYAAPGGTSLSPTWRILAEKVLAEIPGAAQGI